MKRPSLPQGFMNGGSAPAGGKVPSLMAEEMQADMLLKATQISIALVVKNRQATMTVEQFAQALDRIESLINRGELRKQLMDPDPPRYGCDDEYLVCGILMNWKLMVPVLRPSDELLKSVLNQLRNTLSQQGLSGFPTGEQLVDRQARSKQAADSMMEKLQTFQQALEKTRLEKPQE